MEIIAGIDLGTTNSEIAVVIDKAVQMVMIDGDPIMPSCVGLDAEGKLITGQTAKNQMVAAPDLTILSIKRKMGQDLRIPLGLKDLSPEEISSFILLELKKNAERQCGTVISKAVITVPAYFSDRQRKATIDAGTLAGLEVLRIINEPTAAALAYGADHGGDQKMLVYDLGGGTFDVSLVVVEKGVVEVKASKGDTRLGGDDFDQLLIQHIMQQVKEKDQVDLAGDVVVFRRLWKAAEKAKRELSDQPFARIREEYIRPDYHVDLEISRDDYESMITPLIRKSIECVHQCLKDAGFLPRDLDRILLVGGATRTPLVRKMLQEETGIEPRQEVNPDLIVSMGAALQGAAISGVENAAVLVDITPYTFGTSAVGEWHGSFTPDLYVPIIDRNSPLPIKKSEAFYTLHDDQESVDVRVYQGEEPIALDNILIGRFLIEGLSRAPADNIILFNLQLDLNGILTVTATEKSTGLSKTVKMDTRTSKTGLNLDLARRNVADLVRPGADAPPVSAPEGTDRNEAMLKAKDLRARAEKLFDRINEEDSAEIRALIERSKEAIKRKDWETLADLSESLEDMLFYLED